MDISSGDLLSIAAIVISVLVIIIGYCIHVELRFKKLEDEVKLFKTFKEILQKKGEEHVRSIFMEKHP